MVRNYDRRKAKDENVGQDEDEGMMMADGEWGEKVERVWEFLVDTGGLRKASAAEGGATDDAGDGIGDVEMGNGGSKEPSMLGQENGVKEAEDGMQGVEEELSTQSSLRPAVSTLGV